jgi:hypothetical protein
LFYYYWAEASFTAAGQELFLGPRGPGGWQRRYFTDSGMELGLFARSTGDYRGVSVHPGDSIVLELTIHPVGSEDLKEGVRCWIHHFPGQVIGTCEIGRILGKWRRFEERPECLRSSNARFSKI